MGVCFLFASLGAAAAETGGDAWEGVQHAMSAEEFEAAGLKKLRPEELDRLNDWMKRFLAHDSQQIVKIDPEIRKLQNAPVRRRIAGPFRGWSGKTAFTLDNGEVWMQRGWGRYFARLESPEVEISRNLLGFYELRVVATGRSVGVTRVR
jgi:hypothetical protein